MARATTVWGIDIGQVALKALKLRELDGRLQVEAFQVIEHATILSQPDADGPELIRDALQKFLDSENVAGAHVAIAVPGQSSFSRFVKLPPVESKRVPDIVRFEAEQQIPFPINEVIWRYQTFRDPDSPDVEVGIFALKRSDVAEMLNHFNEVSLRVDTVQTAPLALYNFMTFDEQVAGEGATLLADVGADKTDLVVADKGRIWTRTIQIGGNSFTEALVKSFKLSFDKAEKLKRTAASSKYARQIFQAMRPVFADLVQEIQRSVGYYTSLHRETRFKRLVGLGNGFRLPGLQKFIEQTLNVDVARIDSYTRLSPAPGVNAPAFQENVLSFAVAYGLALQGLARAEVATNLLPGEILRKRRWDRKRPWFAAAAVAILAALFCPGYRAQLDSGTLEETTNARNLQEARRVAGDLDGRKREWLSEKDKGIKEREEIKGYARLLGYREFWPAALTMVHQSVEAVAPNQPLIEDRGRLLELPLSLRERILRTGDDEPEAAELDLAAVTLLSDDAQRSLANRLGQSAIALRATARTLIAGTGGIVDANSVAGMDLDTLKQQVKRLTLARKIQEVEAFKKTPRTERLVITVEKLTSSYYADLSAARSSALVGLGGTPRATGAAGPGFQIEMTARTPVPQDRANTMVADLRRYSKALCLWLGSVSVEAHKVDWLPTPGAGGGAYKSSSSTGGTPEAGAPRIPDPLFPDEDMSRDTRFKVTWWVGVTGDGITMTDVKKRRTYELLQPVDLLPDLEPPHAEKAAERIKELPVGSTIVVEDFQRKFTTPWYRVRATDPNGGTLGGGWIDGATLGEEKGQKKVKEASQTP